MKNDFYLVYIGYLTNFHKDPIVLAVSDNKADVKSYLENIRKLNKRQYEIREVLLDWESTTDLYNDYILYEYEYNDETIYIPNRDIHYLNDEVITVLNHYEDLYNNMKEYSSLISNISKLKGSSIIIENALHEMKVHLSKLKYLKKIKKEIILTSKIFTSDILEYLQLMSYCQESRELINLFYKKVEED